MNFNLYQLYQEITISNISNEFIKNPKLSAKITSAELIQEITSIVNDSDSSNFDDNHLLPEDVIKLSQHLSLPLKYFFAYQMKLTIILFYAYNSIINITLV